MSMICHLRQVTDEQIDQLLANPQDIVFLLYGPPPAPKPGLFRRLLRRLMPASTRTQPRPWTPPTADEATDLDKAWHGIHFLLTGSVWGGNEPFCYLVTGGTQVGAIDVGYGPARALRSDQVKRFHETLAPITHEFLRSRYDPAKMKEEDVYPSIWKEDVGALDYLLEYVDILRAFLQSTVQKNRGLLVYIN